MRYKTSSIILPLLFLVSTFTWSSIWESPWLPVVPWSGLGFHDVYFIGPQQGWLVGATATGDIGFIAHTDGDGWKLQFYSLNFVPTSVQFLTPMKGWVGGYRLTEDKKREGILLYTRDGGKHWIERHQFPWAIYHLRFVTEQKGWIVGIEHRPDKTRNSVILATEDGGEHWTIQYKENNEILDDFCFIDLNSGWVLGTSIEQDVWKNFLLHTTDGGKSWSRLPLGDGFIAAIDFANPRKGWAVEIEIVKEEGKSRIHWTILHTQDGGQTWIKQKASTETLTWKSKIRFVDEKRGWAIIGSTILHTDDGGERWTVQDYRLVSKGNEHKIWPGGMFFLDDQRGWIVGTGILYTTDGGATWIQEPQRPFGDLDLNDVIFVTSKEGWVIGDKGAIFHTTDGGLTWQRQDVVNPIFWTPTLLGGILKKTKKGGSR